MGWLVGFGLSAYWGYLGTFLFFCFLALCAPRLLQFLVIFFYGPVFWLGGAFLIWIFGMLFGFLPTGGASFNTALWISAIPSAWWAITTAIEIEEFRNRNQ